jgi:hypothetical protein
MRNYACCLGFAKLVKSGNTVRVKTKNLFPSDVTDNRGNTYTKVSSTEFEATNVIGGVLIVQISVKEKA